MKITKPRAIKFGMWVLIIPLLVLCVLLLVLRSYLVVLKDNQEGLGPKNLTEIVKPRVIEFNACTEDCPLDESVYKFNIYEGVTNSEICADLGGEYKIIFSNIEQRVCAVK